MTSRDTPETQGWAPAWLREETAPEAPRVPRVALASSGGPDGPSPDPEPSADAHGPLWWRPELPDWSTDWREAWGRRAAHHEDAGRGWREAERLAFEEVAESLEAGGDPAMYLPAEIDNRRRTPTPER